MLHYQQRLAVDNSPLDGDRLAFILARIYKQICYWGCLELRPADPQCYPNGKTIAIPITNAFALMKHSFSVNLWRHNPSSFLRGKKLEGERRHLQRRSLGMD
jgi:hypothetical protein